MDLRQLMSITVLSLYVSPAHTTIPNKSLLPYPAKDCVNAKFYNVSTQGPCSEGHIFLEVPESVDKAILRGGALGRGCAYNYNEGFETDGKSDFDPDVEKTLPPLINPDQQYGYCVWDDTRHPCHGRPANQRFSSKTQTCHTLGMQEYCGKNQVFYEQPDSSMGRFYGACDCFPLEESWYDPFNDACFIPHSQGPCPAGQWLTMNSTEGPAFCEPTPCPSDGKHVFWNYGHAACYLMGEEGPCLAGKLMLFPGKLLCRTLKEESGPQNYIIPGPTIHGSLLDIFSFAAKSPVRDYDTFQQQNQESGVFNVIPMCRRCVLHRSVSRHCKQKFSKPNDTSGNCPTFDLSQIPNSPCGNATYSPALKTCV